MGQWGNGAMGQWGNGANGAMGNGQQLRVIGYWSLLLSSSVLIAATTAVLAVR